MRACRVSEPTWIKTFELVSGLIGTPDPKTEWPWSNVSRLEKSADMLLSTLRGYVEAVGGKLHLMVELPNKPPITLSALGDLMEPTQPDNAEPNEERELAEKVVGDHGHTSSNGS